MLHSVSPSDSPDAGRKLEILTSAIASIAGSADLQHTFRNVIDACLPTLGDFGFFDAVVGDGVIRTVGAHQDAETQALLAPTQWARQERSDMNLCALSSGRPALHVGIDDAWYQKVAVAPPHLALMRTLGFRSMVTVPLRFGEETLGALTLFMGRSGRQHDEEDLAFLSQLAALAAPLVDNARLLEAHRQAEERLRKTEAERERLLREVQVERALLSEVFQRSPSFMCVLSGPEFVFTLTNDSYHRHFGDRDVIGKPLRQALPEVEAQGFIALLQKVYQSGEPYVGRNVPVMLGREAGKAPEQRYLDFVYQPLHNADGSIDGVLVQGIDLTEHRRAELALRAKDERLNLLVESIRDYAIVITDPDGIILEWQGGAERITGFSQAEAVGAHIRLIFTDEDIAAGQPEHEMRLAERTGRAQDKRWHVGRDARRFFCDGLVSPVRDEAGRLLGFGKFFRDATREHQAAEALARLTDASERWRRLYETILSSTPDLVYVFDLDHRFTYANEVLLRMWGRTWSEAIGKTCLELGYEPWHAEMHDREIEQVKATRQPIRGEVPFHGAFGRRIYDYIFVPVLGPDGEVEAIAGTTRDVTDRKQSEEEVARRLDAEQRRTALLSRVTEASRSIHAELSLERIAHILTEEARSIIGAHRAITSLRVGQDLAQTIDAVSLSDTYAARQTHIGPPDDAGIYAKVCRTGRPRRMTRTELAQHETGRGFGPENPGAAPMRGWMGVPLVGHDGANLGLLQLSDKYEGEFSAEDEAVLTQLAAIASVGIENARLYEALREQDRRKDEFLAMLAHELRNPLAPLRSGLEILRLVRDGDGDRTAHTHQMMDRQLRHMVRLIDDLMDVSRVSSGKIRLHLEDLPVSAIVQTALETSRPLIATAGHALTVSLPPQPVVVRGDITRLAQVLANLLNNAAKYTPQGGQLSLTVTVSNAEVLLAVQDNGIGIPREMLSEVFGLFTQVGRSLDRAQGGLGIGLSLARKLVELHGGRISAESAGVGTGSTFSVHLPLARQRSP